MVGRKDPFWRYVRKTDVIPEGKEENPEKICIFCGYTFAGGTSITRIKYHLAKIEGRGVKICAQVTTDVQRAASDQFSNRNRMSKPSSSNNMIVTAGSPPAQDLEMQRGQPLLDDVLAGMYNMNWETQQDLEMQQEGQSLLDDELAWMDDMTGGEIVLTEETIVPGILMPDAPETGLGTEPEGQAFEMEMNNNSASLTRDAGQNPEN